MHKFILNGKIVYFEPITLLSALSAVTEHIGLSLQHGGILHYRLSEKSTLFTFLVIKSNLDMSCFFIILT